MKDERLSAGLEEALQKLEATDKDFLEMWLAIAQAFGGAVYPVDLLSNAVIKRSLALTSGFCALIRAKNYSSAASLVRLHLDSVLRFSAVWIVEKPHDFAAAVLHGQQIRDMTDKSGKKMTDRYLVERLAKEDPWMKRVYEATSGFIHLSKAHIFLTLEPTGEERQANIIIGKDDESVPDNLYIEACLAMQAITVKLLWFLNGWLHTKANPPPPKV